MALTGLTGEVLAEAAMTSSNGCREFILAVTINISEVIASRIAA
jgi:hypothetical protein